MRLELLGPDGSALSEDELVRLLEEHLDELASADRFSGTVLVARGDEPLLRRAYGQASKRFDVPNRPETKINLGSMNKMFTGVAICQLAEQGLLTFDDAIVEHLPEYPNHDVAQLVTIHQMLTHTSGLGSYWNEAWLASWTRLRTVADHLPLFVDEPTAFKPGTDFRYSNAGPIVLGLILEELTGQSYYDYVREHVYAPAGMTNTDCYKMDRPVPDLAIGYTKSTSGGSGPGGMPTDDQGDGGWRNNLFTHSVKGGPAGGGFSTVDDLLRFARAIVKHELLSPEMTVTLLDAKVEMGQGMGYAYLFGDDRDHYRWHGHNGGGPGISAELAFSPELDVTIAVLANYDRAAGPVAAFAKNLCERLGPAGG